MFSFRRGPAEDLFHLGSDPKVPLFPGNVAGLGLLIEGSNVSLNLLTPEGKRGFDLSREGEEEFSLGVVSVFEDLGAQTLPGSGKKRAAHNSAQLNLTSSSHLKSGRTSLVSAFCSRSLCLSRQEAASLRISCTRLSRTSLSMANLCSAACNWGHEGGQRWVGPDLLDHE